MRVITWNIRRATKDSPVWDFILELKPDIALLQEVGGIPDEIKKIFQIVSKNAIRINGKPQKFSTAVLVKGEILKEIPLCSEYKWVNREIEFFKGNFISCIVQPLNKDPLNIVSVYSPAWPVNRSRLRGVDTSLVKLKSNPDVWATEIIWSALRNTISNDETWLVGGDYNASETFDKEWQDKHRIKYGLCSSGNREILDRMQGLGFNECLRGHNKRIIPTFVHSDKKIVHQIDHLFVTNDLYSSLESCNVGDKVKILDNSLSDHLPIIAEFN